MRSFIRAVELWTPDEAGTSLEFADGVYNDDLEEFREISELALFAYDEGLPGKAWAAGHPAGRTRGDLMRWPGPDGYWASDERALIDLARVHAWISGESYWAEGRPYDVMARAIENSLVLGLYSAEGTQVGFARFVTDYATFAWLCDVFVDPSARVILELSRHAQRPFAAIAAICAGPY